jgi:hypothetical protein
MVFTPVPSRTLLRDYPDFLFRDEPDLQERAPRAAAQGHRTPQGRDHPEPRARIPFLIVIWGNPDPDAIASSYAPGAHPRFHPDATIAYMGGFTRRTPPW